MGEETYRASTATEGDVVEEVTVRHGVAALSARSSGGRTEVEVRDKAQRPSERERERGFYTVVAPMRRWGGLAFW